MARPRSWLHDQSAPHACSQAQPSSPECAARFITLVMQATLIDSIFALWAIESRCVVQKTLSVPRAAPRPRGSTSRPTPSSAARAACGLGACWLALLHLASLPPSPVGRSVGSVALLRRGNVRRNRAIKGGRWRARCPGEASFFFLSPQVKPHFFFPFVTFSHIFNNTQSLV